MRISPPGSECVSYEEANAVNASFGSFRTVELVACVYMVEGKVWMLKMLGTAVSFDDIVTRREHMSHISNAHRVILRRV